MPCHGQINNYKEVSDMRSDEITTPKLESFPNDNSSGVRLLAYAYGISGKDSKAKSGSGITGLMKELEKTRLSS